MFSNYVKLAFRNLFKRKGYSLLNIFGLSIGITCCLLIFRYVSFERSFDRFVPESEQIYRLRLDAYQQGKLAWKSATVYPAFGPTLKKDFPEVEAFCRLHDANFLLSNDDKQIKFREEKGYFADPAFLDLFGIRLRSGNPATALEGPDKVMLTPGMAEKYFGKEDPIGKKLVLRDADYTRVLEITGVFEELPAQSHLQIQHLMSYKTLDAINRFYGDTSNATETSFGWYDFYTYLKLAPGTDPGRLQEKFPAFCDRYINSLEWAQKNNYRNEIHLIPLTDIHLYSNVNQEAEINGNGQAVSFLFLIAFLIIGIAWINYINLATARSMERAREVGVRKVAGAQKANLVTQFLMESLMLNAVALLFALGFTALLTPWFNRLTGFDSSQSGIFNTSYLGYFLLVFTMGALLSGLYPAFVLSGFRPVTVLKGLFKNSPGGLMLRKGLIVTQFVTSVALIAGTIIVYQQVKYMRSQSLGANIDQTLVLQGAESPADSGYQEIFQPFKNQLLQQTGIQSITASSSVMGQEIYWTSGIRALRPGSQSVTHYILGVDQDFVPSFGLKLAAGRNFSKEFPSDSRAVLLNEKAVELLGFESPEKALNESVIRGDTFKIIGVLGNYHHLGLQKEINPMLVLLRPNARNYYSVKINTGDLGSAIETIGKTWNSFFPSDPFSYYFLDASFDQQYRADRRFGEVFGIFSLLAILIACFGLLGLSAYNILQRTKEVGIRKVLGAPVANILYILSRDFMILVGFAFLLAVPLCWWLMETWLKDFAYRIDISWWVFAVAGFITLIIAFATVAGQALHAAHAKPVKSLRME
ncbi:MAG TPA: ABC transporter permease [Saprospiraceae bacterium]|nr:ABC transporter permease [Saprospiraceae bacterium]